MDEQSTSTHPPDFTTLTAIMERFQTVPYEQFQQELQSWFAQGLAKQKSLPGAADLQAYPGFGKLLALVSEIYHQAEVAQTLSDNQITPGYDDQ